MYRDPLSDSDSKGPLTQASLPPFGTAKGAPVYSTPFPYSSSRGTSFPCRAWKSLLLQPWIRPLLRHLQARISLRHSQAPHCLLTSRNSRQAIQSERGSSSSQAAARDFTCPRFLIVRETVSSSLSLWLSLQRSDATATRPRPSEC